VGGGRTDNNNDNSSSDHMDTSIAVDGNVISSNKNDPDNNNCALIPTDDAEECTAISVINS
jgi:hypothetical protein